MVKERVKLNLREGEEKRLFEKISEKPQQISHYRRLARLLCRRKRPDEAVLVLKMALRRLPKEDPREKKEVNKHLARVYEDSGDFARATRLYRKLIREYPEDFVPYERLERIYKQMGREREMIKILKGVTKENRQRERALKRLFSLEKNLHELNAARRYLKTLINEFGPDFSRLKEFGRLYEKSGYLKQAIRFYKRAAKLKPDNADIILIIGICQGKAGMRKRARKTFEEILRFKPGFYGAHIQLTEMDIEEGELKEAELHLRKLDASWPGNSRVKIDRAHILLKQGKPQEAVDLARDGLGASPFYYTDEMSLGHKVLSGSYGQLGNDQERRYHDIMARRIKGSSDFFKTTAGLIDELMAGDELEMALKVIEGLLKKFPGNSLASLKKAEIYRIQGREDEALSLAERAGRESNPRYLRDKIGGLKLMSELYEGKGLKDKARQSRELANQLAGQC